MKKLLLTFIICNSSLILASAQQTNLDSLYAVWEDESQPDSTRVKAYNSYINKGFLFSKPDSAFVLAEALHVYADKNSYPKASAKGYHLQASACYRQRNFDCALESFQEGLAIYDDIEAKMSLATSFMNIGSVYIKLDNLFLALDNYQKGLAILKELGKKKHVGWILNSIGSVYHNQGNNSKALEFYQKSLAIKEELGDKSGIARTLGNIGLIYGNLDNYARALDYYERSLAINEETDDKENIAKSLNKIGNIYADQGNYTRALEYHKKSLLISEERGDQYGIAKSLNNIGQLYSGQNQYALALDYYQRALSLFKEIDSRIGEKTTLTSIGKLYHKTDKNLQALNYCLDGLALAEEMGILIQQKGPCQCLYDVYKALDKGSEALVYLEKMNVIQDSLHAEETAKKLQQMEFAKQVYQDSVETFEKERQVELAHQEEMRQEEKTRNIAIGSGFLVLLLAGGIYSRLRYVRKSKANLQVEKDRSENLLLNILPEEIAQELKEKGKADARDFEMVSILFTDFKGFTEQSAKLSAAVLVNEINHCFEAFDGIMEKYDIEKIKTIGDAYMAAGGLPVPTDDSVKNTVLAALEMQEFIVQRHQTKIQSGEPAFEMRVGIHTGPVVAGIVGVKKFQYDIWGDTVNTASRMESAGEVGKVNISQATYELLKSDSHFTFESRGKIEAKGKGEMEMWFVNQNEKS